ncbi:MAG: hypothetical protein ACI8SE_001056 [Bacteroidia bacterium]|jgi:hypothetical protein
MEGGKTVATYNNDSTGKSSSTTVDPNKNKTKHKNQDLVIYVPTTPQQCIGADLGNSDTLWFYMNNNGFEFNDIVTAEGIKTDSFVVDYDGNKRVVITGEANGNSSTEYYDDLDRAMKETHNPETGEVKTEGVRIVKVEYDGSNNVVVEYDSTDGSKQTNQSDDIKIIESINPKTGEVTLTKEWVRYVTKMEKGKKVVTYHNDSTKKSASTAVNPDENIYNGNAKTNEDGEVVVELPEYFESLNMEFRYHLTCIGSLAQAIIREEVSNNKFTIKTDKPNVKVSWQITGIRKDTYANDNRVVVEVDKEPENVGSLLHTPNQAKK